MVTVALVTAAALYLALWPVRVDPVAWQPDPPRQWPQNRALAAIQRVEIAGGTGPEDVAIDGEGRAWVGLADGRILRVDPETGTHETILNTGGRPLGLDFDAAGNLLVADAGRGLLRIDRDERLEVLASGAGDRPFRFVDDVDVGPDGRIYFSDASDRFGYAEYRLDIFEGRGNGRLLVHDPATGETRMLVDGLQFANGVAASPDGAFVLVVETGRYRVHRYWLRGERAGQSEIFIDGLPGFPDGISSDGQGGYWMTLATPRSAILEALAGWPSVRRVLARLPLSLFPGPPLAAHVLGLDADGNILHNLQEPDGRPMAYLTSIERHQSRLYLGSLHESAFGILDLPHGARVDE